MNMYSVHKPVHRIEHSPQIGRIWDRIWNLELYPDIFTKTGTGIPVGKNWEWKWKMEFQKKTLGMKIKLLLTFLQTSTAEFNSYILIATLYLFTFKSPFPLSTSLRTSSFSY